MTTVEVVDANSTLELQQTVGTVEIATNSTSLEVSESGSLSLTSEVSTQTVTLEETETLALIERSISIVSVGTQGPEGATGPSGDTGETGPGVPAGGTTGQVLRKVSDEDYDTNWVDLLGGLSYRGAWDASTNSPTLTSGAGTNGFYYVVSVNGSTNLDGITDWKMGDWAIFNGTVWQKIDQTNTVLSVNGQTGAVALNADDVGALAIDGSNANQDVDLGAFSIKVSQIKINTSYTITGSEPVGSAYWNSERETLQVRLNADTALNVFEHQVFYIKNQTGATLSKGKVVRFAGAVGASGRFLADYMISDGSIPAIYTMGLVGNDINNGDDGNAISFGEIRGIATDGSNYSESWLDGDILYVSPSTAGALTNIQPDAPDYAIPVAAVIKAHATNGTLFVRPTFPMRMTDLSDVNGTPLTTDGQIPVWNNAAGYFDFTANINNYVTADLISYTYLGGI